jgi:hypothetical protein
MWFRVKTAKTIQLFACFGIKPAGKDDSMPKYRVVKKTAHGLEGLYIVY